MDGNNLFEQLSWTSILFFLERTNFKEPWNSFGFPTQVKEKLLDAAEVKAKDDGIRMTILENLKKEKGWY